MPSAPLGRRQAVLLMRWRWSYPGRMSQPQTAELRSEVLREWTCTSSDCTHALTLSTQPLELRQVWTFCAQLPQRRWRYLCIPRPSSGTRLEHLRTPPGQVLPLRRTEPYGQVGLERPADPTLSCLFALPSQGLPCGSRHYRS